MTVLDDDGNECPPGVVRRSTCGPGPASRPTYRYIGSTAKSRDGWDSLGDLGWFDTDGYLYLADRRVDIVTVGGRNVYPPRSRTRCPSTRRAVVSGRRGAPRNLGQVPHALVHTEPAGAPDEGGEVDFVAQRLAEYNLHAAHHGVHSTNRCDDAGKGPADGRPRQ